MALLADATADATLALAIGTGILAFATVALAVISICGIRSTRADAGRQIDATRESAASEIEAMRETTAEQVAAARDELDAAHRPLLIEVFPSGPIFPDMGARDDPTIAAGTARRIKQTILLAFAGGPEAEWDPRLVFVRLERAMAYISVPLRNVGRGLAIIDAASIAVAGKNLGSLKTSPIARRVRVPPGETTRIDVIVEFQMAGEVLVPADRWVLTIPYTDFAGRQLTTARVGLGYTGDAPAEGPWMVMAVDHTS